MRHLLTLLSLVFFLAAASKDTYSQSVFDTAKVTIKGDAKIVDNKLLIDFELVNTSESTIYIADEPVDIDNNSGYFVSLDEPAGSVIIVEARVYPPVSYSPYTNSTRILLRKLGKGEKYAGTTTITFPRLESIPPRDRPEAVRKINTSNIERVRLGIGYFVEEEGLLYLLKRKPIGWYIKGIEEVKAGKEKGKRFFEIQKLTTTEIVVKKER